MARVAYMKLVEQLMEKECYGKSPIELLGCSDQSILGSGAKLARKLLDIQVGERWKSMADYWGRLLIYLAVYSKARLHAECLAGGGEFLSQVWVVLGHMGCGEQSDSAVRKKIESSTEGDRRERRRIERERLERERERQDRLERERQDRLERERQDRLERKWERDRLEWDRLKREGQWDHLERDHLECMELVKKQQQERPEKDWESQKFEWEWEWDRLQPERDHLEGMEQAHLECMERLKKRQEREREMQMEYAEGEHDHIEEEGEHVEEEWPELERAECGRGTGARAEYKI